MDTRDTVLALAIALITLPMMGQAAQGSDGRVLRSISQDELGEHASRSDCWTVVDGRVYDISPYLAEHGDRSGADRIAEQCGGHSTGLWGPQTDIEEGTPDTVEELLAPYLIGVFRD